MSFLVRLPRSRGLAEGLELAAVAILGMLAFGVVFGPYYRLVRSTDLGSIGVEHLIRIAAGLWLLSCLCSRRWIHAPARLAIPIACWIVAMLVSTYLASYRADAWLHVSRIFEGVVLSWTVYALATTPARKRYLAYTLALGGVVVAVLGLAEVIGAASSLGLPTFLRTPARVGEVVRLRGVLPHPNFNAIVLELTLPLLLGWALTTRRRWARVLLSVAMLVGLVALALTLSRGGIVSFLVVLALILVVALRQRWRAVLVGNLAIAGSLLAVVTLAMLASPAVALHLTSNTYGSWYRADYESPRSLRADPGEVLSVPIQLTNAGERVWNATGRYPFALSYHLTDAFGSSIFYEGLRTPLPSDVPPGGSVVVQALLVAPTRPGDYVVQWDLVHEEVTWFSWWETPEERTRLIVAGLSAADTSQPALTTTDRPRRPETPGWPRNDPAIRSTSESRFGYWRAAVSMVLSQPLLGVGPGNFGRLYPRYAGEDSSRTSHAHSLYFELLATTGLLGFLAFLWVVWSLARTLTASLRACVGGREASDRGDASATWRLALATCLVAWLAHGFFDYLFQDRSTSVALWMIVGLAARAGAWGEQQQQAGS